MVTKFVVLWSDGTQSMTQHDTVGDAQTSLSESGRTGRVAAVRVPA